VPFDGDTLRSLIRTKTNPKYLEANLQAFEEGMAAAADAANWRKPWSAGAVPHGPVAHP